MAIKKAEFYSSLWASCDELRCGIDVRQGKGFVLHDNATEKIWKGNTLADSQWKETNGQLKIFDFTVVNKARG
ncbi:MAG TPA: hypothetical protein PLA93_12100 [Acinetobacter towneri]|uniref:hypothetical protein n=1 Tax=Acinetobacter sp. YH16051 TaxID=2601190 RepID=UPI0015D3A387|nr:hypothetical protein [Acinetobacter sp. YH16051]HRO79437.1 hypothetical protein [Acinetobacter towneri]